MSHSNTANVTHRKRLARRLADVTGLSYNQALTKVTAAADAGLLPTPLDPDGMDAALAVLTGADHPGPTASADEEAFAEAALKVHKARPNEIGTHCAVCMQRIKRVPGGQGPTWIHEDSGAVAAPGVDPHHPLADQHEDTLAEDRKSLPAWIGFAHEGNPVPRCSASSWRGGSGQRAGEGYGPGGFNRCVKRARHESERHIDEWGNVFELDPKFRVIKNITAGEVARTAARDGIVLLDGSGNPVDPALLDEVYPYRAATDADLAAEVQARFRQNQYVQTRNNEVLKVSEFYEHGVTAQVMYPMPPRTSVRNFTYGEAATWREPSAQMMRRYEEAWGFTD